MRFILDLQSSRRSSVEFSHADPHQFSHIVDEDNHFKDKLKRINELADEDSSELELSGEPTLDAAVVSRWIAKSYGETSQAYHEAYNRELYRQMRILTTTYNSDSDSGASSAKKRAWF